MKTSVRSALWLVMALSPFAYLACSDDSTSGASTSTGGADASITPTPTATATSTSMPVDDAGTDAGPTTGPVTATVLDPLHHPEAGISIVFYDATGAVVTTGTTDATGKATATVPTGGSLTAVYGTATDSRLFTVLGVKPGDQIALLDDKPLVETKTTFSITRPDAFPGTTSLSFAFGTCGGPVSTTTNPSAVNLNRQATDQCWNESSSVAPSLLLVASANGTAVATSVVTDYTLVDNGTTAVTFTDWTAITASANGSTVTNIPAAGAVQPDFFGGLYHDLGIGTALFQFSNPQFSAGDTPPTTSVPFSLGGAFQQDEAVLVEEPTGDTQVARSITTRQVPTANASLDLGTLLPAITGAVRTVTNGVPSIAITSQQALTSTKALVVMSQWNSQTSAGRWTVLSPPSATTVAPPALPAALAAFGPGTDAEFQTPSFASAADLSTAASYDAVRPLAGLFTVSFGARVGDINRPLAPPLPVDGTLKLTAYGYNND